MTDLVMRGIDEKEAEMFMSIHHAIVIRAKCGIQINLSGNPKDFSYIYLNLHPEKANKIIEYEPITSEKTANEEHKS